MTSKLKPAFDLRLHPDVPVDRFGYPRDQKLKYFINLHLTNLIFSDEYFLKCLVRDFNKRQSEILMEKGERRDKKKSKQSNTNTHENNN